MKLIVVNEQYQSFLDKEETRLNKKKSGKMLLPRHDSLTGVVSLMVYTTISCSSIGHSTRRDLLSMDERYDHYNYNYKQRNGFNVNELITTE